MALREPNWDSHVSTIEEAGRRFQRDRGQLFTADGRDIYAPEEQRRRLDALQSSLQAVVDETIQSAEKHAETVAQELAKLSGDPLDKLSPEQLQQAAARASFVAEDYTALTYRELVPLAQAALLSGDKARQALHYRYGTRRLERDLRSAPRGEAGSVMVQTAGSQEGRGDLAALVRELEVPFSDEAVRADLEAQAQRAKNFRFTATHTRDLFNGADERHRAAYAQYMIRSF